MLETRRRRTNNNVAFVGLSHQLIQQERDKFDEAQDSIWTFRVMILGTLSFLFLYILNKYIFNHTEECVIAMVSTLVVSYALGYIMGKIIPQRIVYYPTIGFQFSVNPAPFGPREYAIISILANIGAIIGGFTSDSLHSS
ncbi:hypothetical protein BUALT_Bualt08G0029300 [Buddleja alternifolia]|uniref:Uncharacterized protein n=1 Tax=Buddleja alternifolia TaxID=168488 RepID=A0AAV6XBQ6_9LAMI|nr:hypothetical protein BUALT_Bualt08G0029300 [Buddleja alternifolia]